MQIKDYLKEYKKRPADLSRAVNCSPAAMSLWMSGDRFPSREMAAKIIAATNGAVTYEDLYGNPAAAQHAPEQREAA